MVFGRKRKSNIQGRRGGIEVGKRRKGHPSYYEKGFNA